MAITQDVKGSLMQVPMLDLKAQFATIKDEVMPLTPPSLLSAAITPDTLVP